MKDYYDAYQTGETAKVRVCRKCGTVYSEKNRECISCSERLGDAMDMESAERLSSDIRIKRGLGGESYEITLMKRKLSRAGKLSLAALGVICADTIAYAVTFFNQISVPQNIETPALMIICAMMLMLILNLVFCFAPEVVFRSAEETHNVRKSSTSSEDALYNSGTRRRKRIEGAFKFSKPFIVYCIALPVVCLVFSLAVMGFYLFYLL